MILFFFITNPTTPKIYTLSLHDALPILAAGPSNCPDRSGPRRRASTYRSVRSEEHTSELQSQSKLVCRLLHEKKNIEVYPLQGHSSAGTPAHRHDPLILASLSVPLFT